MPLIDEFLPTYHFRERHERVIGASAQRVAASLRNVDLARSPFVGPLFALRSLPSRFARARGATAPNLVAGRLGDFFDQLFVVLRDDPPRGLAAASVGAFWRAAGGVQRFAPAEFPGLRPAGCARLVWAFEFEPLGPARCRAVTETRIECVDARARRAMRLYWYLIRPASGLIRRETLRLLARDSEQAARSG